MARAAGGNAAGHRGAAAGPAESVTRQALAVRRAAISAAVLAVAVLVGAVTAGAATPSRTALREIIELPVDPAAFVSPLSTSAPTPRTRPTPCSCRSSGLPAGARLRLAALDAYDGRQFTLSNSEGPFVRIGRETAGTAIGEPATVGRSAGGLRRSVPAAPGPIERTGLRRTAARPTRTEDLRYSEAAATGLMPGGWQQRRSLHRHGRRAAAADRRATRRRRAPWPLRSRPPSRCPTCCDRPPTGTSTMPRAVTWAGRADERRWRPAHPFSAGAGACS